MTVEVTVLYPNEEDATFNMDYYLSTHMPLVSDKWQKYGLKGWRVVQFQPGPDGAKPQYSTQATLIWDAPEDLQKAMGSEETKEVLGDVPNFSNKQPVFIAGPVLKTASH
ncbi:hypothetical protein PMZ80_004597 [Knufia obscura]|uniref:EthD domain-containing protein n=2 Tax=Knufia TaxID=430999 RepID=A0AAN8ECV9_9EURO|nr:hypothetical protein PMZ80_004597 [Knufia obscura]KAK5952589.1 hypothetical protein OHC33_006181 [Knufia fluminis]